MKRKLKALIGPVFMQLLRRVKMRLFSQLPEEPAETVLKRQQFYSQFINPQDLVFDVGANVGNRTKPLLNLGAKVIAVEPQKECIEILQRKFGASITIVPFGLGEEEGMQDFYISNANPISSFSSEWIESLKNGRFKGYTWAKPIKIKMTTLDKLIAGYGLPKFIKIDVEGYELEVLKGLTQAVEIISFEYTVPEHTHNVIDCIKQIERFNPEIECNFSVGETMELSSDAWQSVAEFIEFASTQSFSATRFGDVYVRKTKVSLT